MEPNSDATISPNIIVNLDRIEDLLYLYTNSQLDSWASIYSIP